MQGLIEEADRRDRPERRSRRSIRSVSKSAAPPVHQELRWCHSPRTAKNFQAEVDRLTRIGSEAERRLPTRRDPRHLLEDVEDPKKGSSVKIEAGTRVGLHAVRDRLQAVPVVHAKLRAQNPALLNETVKVKLTHEKKTKGSNNEWGVLNFELIEG
jgi:hypothetical protein